mmetsp:Transcript_14171/g.19914  ORF Transcript_14171/g.19914 Transcript_14171/m.19914 type:complete len:109 (+) Transcript_14171:129-455(+)
MMKIMKVLLAATLVAFTSAFVVPQTATQSSASTKLFMANDEDLLRWARSSRSASTEDRVVELKRPLGVVLNEDDNGNVYVETLAPKGNAARTGQVRDNFLKFCRNRKN